MIDISSDEMLYTINAGISGYNIVEKKAIGYHDVIFLNQRLGEVIKKIRSEREDNEKELTDMANRVVSERKQWDDFIKAYTVEWERGNPLHPLEVKRLIEQVREAKIK